MTVVRSDSVVILTTFLATISGRPAPLTGIRFLSSVRIGWTPRLSNRAVNEDTQFPSHMLKPHYLCYRQQITPGLTNRPVHKAINVMSTEKPCWCRGPDLNRQAVRRRIFFTLRLSTPTRIKASSPTRYPIRPVRALDYAFTIAHRATGAPRLVSTPSRIHCTAHINHATPSTQAWLGVAAALTRQGFRRI
jgi:hypothetical protein